MTTVKLLKSGEQRVVEKVKNLSEGPEKRGRLIELE